MQNPLKKHLILCFAILSCMELGLASHSEMMVDSAARQVKTWKKITVQMNHFTKAVNAYVKLVTKVKPADTVYAESISRYSDSVDHSIRKTNPDDTSGIQKVERLFDSLLVSTNKLIKRVETDSAFTNNKAVKQLSGAMQNLRTGITNYQKELNANAAKRREKKASSLQ